MDSKQKEIDRLHKAQKFHSSRYYLILLVVVLTIVYVVDELTSNIRESLQTYTICDIFNTSFNSESYASGQATLGLFTTAAYLVFLISPFYKSLADRYGRKIFLVINTLGMGVGMLVAMTSQSLPMYIVGCVLMTFFTPNDMQVIYMMECAPKKHRVKLCTLTKGIALISVSLLGVFIRAYVSYENPTSWRYVYIFPVILALFVGILAIFFVKETPIFTSERLSFLKMSEEEKKEIEKEKEIAKRNEMGVPAAFKYIFKHPQTRYLAIVVVIFAFSSGYSGMFEPMLTAGVNQEVLSIADKANFMIIYPFFNGFFTLIGGFISDKLGRKKSSLFLGLWAIIGLAVFVYGTTIGLNVYLMALGYGISIAGLWSISDMLYFVITSESTPTDKRGAVVGCMQLIGMAGTGLNMVFNAMSSTIFGTSKLAIGLSFTYLPVMIVAIMVLMFKVKETRDIDLDRIEE